MPFKPTDEDASLWEYVTKGLRRMTGGQDAPKTPASKRVKIARLPEIVPLASQSLPMNAPHLPQLNRRDAEKLRKGKMAIEAHIDLHGMTQEQAHPALYNFITGAVQRKMRCVLVITGKGRIAAPSILREKVPQWLSDPALSPVILQVSGAQPKDGGSGALYVYLKRVR